MNKPDIVTKSALMNPGRVVEPLWWAGHIPFAMWLVEKIKPQILVELGVHIGNSYFAMCHSVKTNGLLSRCYAVDTWKGDSHQGYYDEDVYSSVKKYNDENYSEFSELLRMTFNEAVSKFEDSSIDFLHIDGLHTYEAVRHDFETWLPKLSNKGIVLLHDVMVWDFDFGVWRLWEELSGKYPNILFEFSQGLGVIFVGDEQPKIINDLLKTWATPERQIIHQFFERLGRTVELGFRTANLEHIVLNRDKHIAEINAQITKLEQIVANLSEKADNNSQTKADCDSQLVDMQQMVADFKEENNNLQNAILERDERIAGLSHRLSDIESSLKWYVAIRIWQFFQSFTPQFLINAIKRIARHNWRSNSGVKQKCDNKDAENDLFDNSGLLPFHTNKSRFSRILRKMFAPVFVVVRSYKTKRILHTIKLSGLFDVQYYLGASPNVLPKDVDPLRHYLEIGWKEHLNPSPLFDTDWYLQQNPDVLNSGLNPLLHFVEHGAAEGRSTKLLFLNKDQDTNYLSPETTQLSGTYASKSQQCHSKPESLAERSIVYAFTSICLNYLPKARLLAETLKRHNPEVRFCLLVNEPIPVDMSDSFDIFDEVATLENLNIPNKQSWLFRHSVVELCTAVKGFYMLELLERPECSVAFYFDPDIAVFSDIDVLLKPLKNASILLTPHQTEPEETIDTIIDNEICSLKHGIYNLGFLGVKSSTEGLRFARWWRDRLYHFCRADIAGGLFTDQRWIDLVPAFFTDIHILRHPGCNVSTWNLSHRHVEGDFSKGFTVNGQALIFYHFSGFDSGAQKIMLNKYGNNMPAAKALRQWYIAMAERPEDKLFANRKWKYNYFTNGELISIEHRRLYRDRADLQQTFPHPFGIEGSGNSFCQWYKVEILGRYSPGKLSAEKKVTISTNNPSNDRKNIIQWATSKKKLILFVGHHGGGGTQKHICELADHMKERAGFLLLIPKRNGEVLLTTLPAENMFSLRFDPVAQFEELACFLEMCKIDRIHIHHELGNEHYLERLVHRLKKHFDFTVHDYYALSPNPQLIGPNNHFVGEDLAANSGRLLAMSVCSKKPKSLTEWQDSHRWLLTEADRVIVPSQDTAHRLKLNIPTLKPIVAAHIEKSVPHHPIHLEKIDADTNLRIAVLGQISPPKGYDVFYKCAMLARKNKYPLSFDLIGHPFISAASIVRAGVRISGAYNDRDLQKIIREYRPHIIWYPALWPEVYSYTLSAGFDACLPVAVPNLGAFPERIAGRRWSWLCQWNLNPADWAKFFVHIRKAHFLAGIEPECPIGTPPSVDNFYEHEYLSWLVGPPKESVITGGKTDVVQQRVSK
ncbi:MAG: hypothetical protein A2Y10_05800 [Planctomycetes bacterium GWF2_41_51]|nr:MAG: hypothetical protein A2Y10_05800 [Planctomycetes bacterium GWF2_41_51]